MSSELIHAVISATSPHPDRRLRVNNVAKRLGVSERDVRYHAAKGKLHGFKVGKLWFFWESDVLEYQRGNWSQVY